MAMQVLYTGENSAVKLPDLDRLIQSQEQMGNKLIAGQEKLLQRKEKDSAFVLEQMKANPVLLITDKLRTEQANAIKDYNDKGARLLAENDGILSDEAKLSLQREKDALTMMQQSMQADQIRYQRDKELMAKDTGYYDSEAFTQEEQNFLNTGKYAPDALRPRPQSLNTILLNYKGGGTENRRVEEQTIGGQPYKSEFVTRMNQQEAEGLILSQLGNEAVLRGTMKEFLELPDDEAAKYIADSDKDGKISPEERRVQTGGGFNKNNPIIRWAIDKYTPLAMAEKENTSSRIVVPSAKASFSTNSPISATNNRNASNPLSPKKRDYGKFSFPTIVDIKESTTGSVVINNPIDADTGKVIPVSATAELDISGYSPQTDQIIVKVKKATRGLRENQILILDGETYKGILENKEVGIHRASYDGFGKGATQATMETIVW